MTPHFGMSHSSEISHLNPIASTSTMAIQEGDGSEMGSFFCPSPGGTSQQDAVVSGQGQLELIIEEASILEDSSGSYPGEVFVEKLEINETVKHEESEHEAQVSPVRIRTRRSRRSRYNPLDFPKGDERTLMLRNIPNKYSQSMLLQAVDDAGFKAEYDYFYLPIDFKNKCNVGYAFINFTNKEAAERFKCHFTNRRLTGFNSDKICQVSQARVQGRAANVKHYQNSPINGLTNPAYKPMIFEEGEQVPFPAPDGTLPEIKQRNPSPQAKVKKENTRKDVCDYLSPKLSCTPRVLPQSTQPDEVQPTLTGLSTSKSVLGVPRPGEESFLEVSTAVPGLLNPVQQPMYLVNFDQPMQPFSTIQGPVLVYPYNSFPMAFSPLCGNSQFPNPFIRNSSVLPTPMPFGTRNEFEAREVRGGGTDVPPLCTGVQGFPQVANSCSFPTSAYRYQGMSTERAQGPDTRSCYPSEVPWVNPSLNNWHPLTTIPAFSPGPPPSRHSDGALEE